LRFRSKIQTALTLLRKSYAESRLSARGQNYFEDFESGSTWQTGESSEIATNNWDLGTLARHGFPQHGPLVHTDK
jgi:hypothetical protein